MKNVLGELKMDSKFNKTSNWWDNIAPIEEADFDDEYINRQLRWREIDRNLDGVETILDIGGATGVFSIPLAKKGYKVTHVDISEKMIEIAKQKSNGLTNIEFVRADSSELNMFKDKEFDLVLNFDGPISFSGVKAGQVIAESCRVTRKKLLVTVSNKACMAATWLNYSIKSLNTISPAVYEMMKNGFWDRGQFEQNENLCSISTLKAFSVGEIRSELEKNMMKVIFSRSIGSLTHLYLLHLYRQLKNEQISIVMKDTIDKEGFIDLCELYDKEIMPNGPGSFRRAGIIALSEPID